LAAYSIFTGETSFLDVAIGFALVAFLGTVALARFLMRSALNNSENMDSTDKVLKNE
jgi:multicomponent Na+:H+ antiporter subunit F